MDDTDDAKLVWLNFLLGSEDTVDSILVQCFHAYTVHIILFIVQLQMPIALFQFNVICTITGEYNISSIAFCQPETQ